MLISTSDYTTLTGTGVWKLSGSYSIGLGGTTASASVRYTVASDAKMYYIDTDGVITKIDDVKNISSDSTATYIGLLDVTDGDIAYLFIQEVDNGKQEGAGSQRRGPERDQRKLQQRHRHCHSDRHERRTGLPRDHLPGQRRHPGEADDRQRDWRRDNDDRHHLCRSVCRLHLHGDLRRPELCVGCLITRQKGDCTRG